MNSWCESCARKNCCYTMEIIPKCYLPTTNTAHGTPETYLAKSLRYSRDSHEIAKDEPQTCSVNGRPYSDCSSCEHFRCTADEPQIIACPINERAEYWFYEDEPQTERKDK